MGTTKHKFDPGSQERIQMFGHTQMLLEADDSDRYVAAVDLSGLAASTNLTLRQQPSCAHTLSFVAPIAKAFTAKLKVVGWDAFGERAHEFVEISGDATSTGLVGDPWPCVQTRIPYLWIDYIQLVSYSEASATGAGTIEVGLICDRTNIGAAYYDNPGMAIQVQRGVDKADTYCTTEELATGVLTTVPVGNVTVDAATGRYVMPDLNAGPARLLSMRIHPKTYPRS